MHAEVFKFSPEDTNIKFSEPETTKSKVIVMHDFSPDSLEEDEIPTNLHTETQTVQDKVDCSHGELDIIILELLKEIQNLSSLKEGQVCKSRQVSMVTDSDVLSPSKQVQPLHEKNNGHLSISQIH